MHFPIYIWVLWFLFSFRCISGFEKLKEQFERIANHQDEELNMLPPEQYNEAVARKQGKIMFEHMDTNHDGLVNRAEMAAFGKVILTEDSDQLEFWIGENFKNDENKDRVLTFEEFFKPQIDIGETSKPAVHQRDEL